jgi:ParB-like chromosome segregation protein Spo0J
MSQVGLRPRFPFSVEIKMSLRDPFNPQTGEFAKNIRGEGDLSDLRESMALHGWVEEFPALMDERAVVLVGHRRMAVAKELGIAPVIKKLTLGLGDAADAKRLQLALVSNIGAKPLTAADRQRIAEYLYGEREWTMQRIAEALGVGFSTVQRDLGNLPKVGKSIHAPTVTNPKGAGRPKKARKNESAAATIAAKLILDAGQSYPAVEKETGLTSTVLRSAVAREEGRREPVVTREMLSATAQQKFDRAISQHKAELAASFQQSVAARVKEMLEDTYLPRHRKEQAEAKAIMNRRHGIMTKAVFNAIRRGLHPDSRRSISDEMLGAAFDAFMALEKRLLKEEDSPTTFVDIPSSLAEWDKKRAAKRPRTAHAIRRRA